MTRTHRRTRKRMTRMMTRKMTRKLTRRKKTGISTRSRRRTITLERGRGMI